MMDNTNLKSRMGAKVQAISGQESIHLPADTGSDYIALTHNALDIIRENLKNQPLPFQLFDLVKSPSGGSTVFSVPGLSRDEAERELTGIILDYTTPRAYWDTPDPVEGTPPTCMSKNSLISEDGKPCAHCPFNDFGSKDGESNAKACKESVLLFLLRPDSIFPLLVRVPVTSKMLFLKYTTRLVSRLTPLSSVVTRITLEKATSRAGKPYALFQFDAVGILSPEEAAKAREFGRQFMEIANAAEIEPVFTEAS
ncbi:hypothetical protein [Pseudoflavonifractor phocaeensis]|uniref:hypothetical protein n=1 Tax=Pseudoflavonifractor phocaeensis TaxID=1870988 RepID=UPI00195EA5BF|nr:hypothetical protein [Pseudoflavonifractor phocaeensis]MBM6723286.1 hypothetical protein [Pseudoflavonifractor phocaeensis]